MAISHFRLNIFGFTGKVKAYYDPHYTNHNKRNGHAECFSGKTVKHDQITWKYPCNASKYAANENEDGFR